MRGGRGGQRARHLRAGAEGIGLSSGERCECVKHGASDDAGACQDRMEQIRHRLHIRGGLGVAEANI
mgnify:CR=1 FL=1